MLTNVSLLSGAGVATCRRCTRTSKDRWGFHPTCRLRVLMPQKTSEWCIIPSEAPGKILQYNLSEASPCLYSNTASPGCSTTGACQGQDQEIILTNPNSAEKSGCCQTGEAEILETCLPPRLRRLWSK
ncbi:hypothetical protein NPIL_470561 [Nephila pilipes]|uniref:Uncharacterized protein n=1 Tax=Nephila pilipes TaxID=299642 RepID=A0A8X6QUK0_NEPPI|nr:hypothetical protein NPIL_470561 [Nephila pilipes]